jgi:signal transduction histidine kinase
MTAASTVPDFKALFEAAPGRTLVLLADAPTFTVVAANDGYLQATGKRRSELVGRGLFELFSGDLQSPGNPLAGGAQRLQDSLLRAVSSGVRDSMPASAAGPGAARWSFVNIPVAGAGGQTVHVIHSLEIVHRGSPEEGGEGDLLIHARALEEAKATLEARVKERTQDLQRSNNELEQFAYIASHDLQTPLRHVSSYVQLLTTKIRKTTVLDAKTEKWIAYILTGTQQMKSLITDLLAYSRVGRMDITVEEFDLNKVIADVTEELQDQLRSSKGRLVYGDLPRISGIRSQLAQLFQNLIENALKFKHRDVAPVVTVSCEDRGEFWLFSVSDNGIGIEPKYFDRIFLMFHRLHPSSEYAGTGIGLAICKKVVGFHGGQIGVESSPGSGSTFSFSLPKKERITSTVFGDKGGGLP